MKVYTEERWPAAWGRMPSKDTGHRGSGLARAEWEELLATKRSLLDLGLASQCRGCKGEGKIFVRHHPHTPNSTSVERRIWCGYCEGHGIVEHEWEDS